MSLRRRIDERRRRDSRRSAGDRGRSYRELADALEYDFNGPGRYPQYDAFTNNCSQYVERKVIDAAKLSPLRFGAGLVVDFLNGPDLSTNAALGSLMAYGLIGGGCQ